MLLSFESASSSSVLVKANLDRLKSARRCGFENEFISPAFEEDEDEDEESSSSKKNPFALNDDEENKKTNTKKTKVGDVNEGR